MNWAILNFIGAWYLWNFSQNAFEQKMNYVGWLSLFLSAANFAAGINTLL